MPVRAILRITLSLTIIVLLWIRTLTYRHTSSWVAGLSMLTAILLLGVLMQLIQLRRGKHRPKDEVPKRPLGLE
jgi:hypothetical protein